MSQTEPAILPNVTDMFSLKLFNNAVQYCEVSALIRHVLDVKQTNGNKSSRWLNNSTTFEGEKLEFKPNQVLSLILFCSQNCTPTASGLACELAFSLWTTDTNIQPDIQVSLNITYP